MKKLVVVVLFLIAILVQADFYEAEIEVSDTVLYEVSDTVLYEVSDTVLYEVSDTVTP